MIRATTIYNRAGIGHLWRKSPSDPAVVRSLCGLVDKMKHLDGLSAVKECRRCNSSAEADRRFAAQVASLKTSPVGRDGA